MNSQATRLSGRLTDPAITSVIFAPRLQNYNLLSVTIEEQVPEEIAFECLVFPDELLKGKVFENISRAVWKNISQYLHEYLTTAYTSVTLEPVAYLSTSAIEGIPARAFPFASHLDLLSSPTEGLLFDADDFVER